MATIDWIENILVLAKTYPSPSAQYVETSCIAGVSEDGLMRRLFPVPFRLLQDGQQFKKWQWIAARVKKTANDHRPESHRIYVDTIQRGTVIDTRAAWGQRRLWLNKTPSFADFALLEQARKVSGTSLALLGPVQLVDLNIIPAKQPQWTDNERAKLIQAQMQEGLFSEDEAQSQIITLRKLPFDFYYQYLCITPEGAAQYRHKIVDWEVGALFWNCRKNYGSDWMVPFRAKLLQDMKHKELSFLMGNIHRFPHQWLIISLFYPPKPVPVEQPQLPLL